MTKTLAIVQARMRASRFPGKPLKSIGDWSLIELVLRRVSMAKRIDHVILATSGESTDDNLADQVNRLGFEVYRGSEEDVLSRFFEAAVKYKPTIIVRITGDCPLISPHLIDLAVEKYQETEVDYLTISIGEDKERAYPRGFDVEVAAFSALKDAAENAEKGYEREHVMPYLYTHPDKFTVKYIDPPPEASRPRYRLCVDTQLDFKVILRIHEHFGKELLSAEYQDIIHFLDDNPEVPLINQTIKQKHFTESDTREGQ